MKRTLPTGLEKEIRSELGRLGAPDAGDLTEVVGLWPRCVGAAIAANAWPARFARDGSLVVHVSSSAWGFELTQLEAEILARFGAHAPKRLKFVPGPLPEGDRSVPEVERARSKIRPEAHAKGAALAAEITDPALRELVAKAAALSLSKTGPGNEATGSSGRLEER